MLKKLTSLSLSLILCAAILPAQAGAMDAPENDPPVQVEEREAPVSPEENGDAGIAPCQAVTNDPWSGGAAGSPNPMLPGGDANLDGCRRPYYPPRNP